jgi:hypothetical protein
MPGPAPTSRPCFPLAFLEQTRQMVRQRTIKFQLRQRGEGVTPVFPPLDHAVVKALACEVVSQTHQPLSRQALADWTGRAHPA